jgi:hypothetical protein
MAYNPFSNSIAQKIETLVTSYSGQRKSFERRWYDNLFFDDGYHFRYVSRTTGRLLDVSNQGVSNSPQRAIPKSSRQLRGIANLIVQPDYHPYIYPTSIDSTKYIIGYDQNFKPQYDPKFFEMASQQKQEAKRAGWWIEQIFYEQCIKEKLVEMVLSAGKTGVAFMQVYQPYNQEKIVAEVYDAFDIYLDGTLTDIYKCPAIIKSCRLSLDEIKSNEYFDEEARNQLNPDNRYATSEIKDAYEKSRFGMYNADIPTIIQKESFIKEYLTDKKMEEIAQTDSSILQGRKLGDSVIRHVFSAAGVKLSDEYLDLSEYPFVDFRFEPGKIYQTPLIERFIPANKSMDIAVSRVEKFANTMVTGMWLKRKGENFKITNVSGAQVVEYTATPPAQAPLANIPPFMFEFIQFLSNVIDEQGASTSTLNRIPSGVRSAAAIESMKATEYANLKIPGDMVQFTVRRLCERILEIGEKFIEPQQVNREEKVPKFGTIPSYYSVMGQKGINARNEIGENTEGIVPIKKDYKLKVEVVTGMGFTNEGRKQSMQQIVQFLTVMASQGHIPPEAVKMVIEKFLDVYQYGPTNEFMEVLDTGQEPMTEEQLQQMKVAIAEVVKDLGIAGKEADDKQIMTSKIGTLEALTESGVIKKVPKNMSEVAIDPTKAKVFNTDDLETPNYSEPSNQESSAGVAE